MYVDGKAYWTSPSSQNQIKSFLLFNLEDLKWKQVQKERLNEIVAF